MENLQHFFLSMVIHEAGKHLIMLSLASLPTQTLTQREKGPSSGSRAMPRPGDCGLSLEYISTQLEKATSNCMDPEQAGVSSVSGPGLA